MKHITFINAGAGSGKTYRLTTDLARMLTQENLNPSQVILTTYTELAAAEFREKARKEILNAKDADENLVSAQVRINSATQLDNAFIGTVHAISFRFIRKYWYLLDYGADIQPMSTQNLDFYMSQSISNIVTDEERKVFRKYRDFFDIRDIYSHPDYLFWLPELKNIVDKMEYYDIQDVNDSIKESKQIASKIFNGMPVADALKKINDYLQLLKKRCEDILSTKSHTTATEFVKAIDNAGTLTRFSDLKKEGLDKCMKGTVGGTKDSFYSTSDYKEAMAAYKEVFVSRDFLPIINEYIDTIISLAVRWLEALSKYKKENHIITFDDMEKIFLAMLTEDAYKEVQKDIAANFRLLMVDEFQDSNPIQLKIFNRISELIAPKGGHSIWVGDPKQAIYGFRGSDSRFIAEILSKFTFSDDGTAIPEQGTDMLGTDQLGESWRSRPALVDFSNDIFLEPFKKGGLKEKQITLIPHFKDHDTLKGRQSLYTWRTEIATDAPRIELLSQKIQKLLGEKWQVHHNQCDKPTSEIEYRDIAVLCFSNQECNDIASALRKLGLPVSCEEPNLMQCREVYLLKTILLFMLNPSDKMLRAELAILLDNATTEEILRERIDYRTRYNEENRDKKDEDKDPDIWLDADTSTSSSHAATIARLAEFVKRYESLSVYDAVVAICEELDLDNIVRKWGDATQRTHNLATVVNMAKAYDDMCLQMAIGTSITGFINYLTTTEPENHTDNSANTIKVLTYHRSKGLEWPVVILYSLWKDINKEEDIIKKKFKGVNVCEVSGSSTDIFSRNHYINLIPTGIIPSGTANIPELMSENIKSLTLFSDLLKQTEEETLRLLYVGVTRAKDYLIAVTSKKANGEVVCKWPMSLGIGNGSTVNPWGKDYGCPPIELKKSILGTPSSPVATYQATTNEPAINPAAQLSLSPSTIDSFSDSFTKSQMLEENNERILDMKMFAGEQSDAVKGTCIHNFFAVYKHGDDDEYNVRMATQTLSGYGFSGALPEQKERLLLSIKWLYDFLTNNYGTATRIERECPLLYPLPSGQILRGEIDLLWFYQDEDSGKEKCVLVDYKTFPGKRDQLEEHTKKYFAQLSAYHAALVSSGISVADTLVYYPVQAHVRRLSR